MIFAQNSLTKAVWMLTYVLIQVEKRSHAVIGPTDVPQQMIYPVTSKRVAFHRVAGHSLNSIFTLIS